MSVYLVSAETAQNFKIVNVVSHGVVDGQGAMRLGKEIQKILDGTDKKKSNYNLESIDLEGHLEFDLLVDAHEQLVTFCGIYSGNRYPEGVYRILNRTYVAPAYRAQVFAGYASRFLLPAQLERCGGALKFAFVSREHHKAKYFLSHWVECLAPDRSWTLSDVMVQVQPKAFTRECFQFIAYRSFSKDFTFNTSYVKPEEWVSSLKSNCDFSRLAKPCKLS
jgi:hypothetical protein